MIEYWIADFTRLSQEQYFCVRPAAPIQSPSVFDPWGEADEDRVPSGPPSIDMDQIRWKVDVRLNTRCHLLAFAAKVEKQLQATVSIQ